MITQPKIPLTVIILTNRSDARFEKALNSVSWAAQVLVVNTNAQLQLDDLKKEYNFELVHQPTNPDSFNFSTLRNKAILIAKHEWIFFLDSDEWLPAKWVPEIIARMENKTCYAVSVKRQDIFLGRLMRWGEIGNVNLVRLGKKSYLRFSRAVHEIPFTDHFVCHSPLTIMHESHLSTGEFFSKISWYAQLEAKERLAQGSTFNLLEALLYPVGKFVVNYFLKLGLLDGWRGFIYALMMSCHSLFVRIYLYELQKSR